MDHIPDTYPRWALMIRPHNRIEHVLLASVERRIAQGWILIGREDEEMFKPQTFTQENWDANIQSHPQRVEPDDNGANDDDGDCR